MELNQQEESPPHGWTVPTNVTSFKIDDENIAEGYIEAAVRRLKMNRAGGNIHLQVEHLHPWRREAYPSETSTNPPTQPGG